MQFCEQGFIASMDENQCSTAFRESAAGELEKFTYDSGAVTIDEHT